MLRSVFIKDGNIPFLGGKSVEVKQVIYGKYGIDIKIIHRTSFGHSKPIMLFIPYNNLLLIEEYESNQN